MTQELCEIGEVPSPGRVPAKMHAWVIRPDRFGAPSVAMKSELVDVPSLNDDEVLVSVMAAGVNYNNIWAGFGKPVDVIAARNRKGEMQPFHIGGCEGSGIVCKVGRNVLTPRLGAAVVLHPGQWDLDCPLVKRGMDPMYSPTFRAWGYESNFGCFAQFCKVQSHQCLRKPKHLSWLESAGYIASGATAYRMLMTWPGHVLGKDDVVLVWGGAGGLGSMAIRIAKFVGARAVAVVSTTDRAEYCHEIGAAACINRNEFNHWGALPALEDTEAYGKWLRGARSFGEAIWKVLGERKSPKFVFEHIGETTLPTSVFVCDTGGMVVCCAGTSGYRATLDLRYLWMRQKRFQGSHFANSSQASEFNELVCGRLVDVIPSTSFCYEEAADAHQLMYKNLHPAGKMVVLVGAHDREQGRGD